MARSEPQKRKISYQKDKLSAIRRIADSLLPIGLIMGDISGMLPVII